MFLMCHVVVSSPSFFITSTRDGIGEKTQIKRERIYQRATCTLQEASERAKQEEKEKKEMSSRGTGRRTGRKTGRRIKGGRNEDSTSQSNSKSTSQQ